MDVVAVLPVINACLNTTSAVCLALGFWAIRRRRKTLHQRLMLTALASSTLFLVGYVTRLLLTGTHHFPDVGPVKTAYLALLFSHMLLAVGLLPMVLRALYLAFQQRFGEHRQWARWTWPTWMYVSLTGVLVYWMLYHLAPRLGLPS